MTVRVLAGLLIALTVALAARRAHALSLGGAAAAVVVGALAVAAGWAWGALLIAYFVASIALSRLRSTEKAHRTGDIVAKGGARDAFQVVANGGLFAVTALAGASLGAESAVPVMAVVLGGFLGAIADSVVGATLQDRRWCDTCQKSTERMIHGCGTPTRHAGGITIVDNDLVNLIATFAGAAIAALLVYSSRAT